MKLLTADFPSSFFKQNSKCLSTYYESPHNSNLKSLFVLRNVFIWLVMINIVNFCLSVHYKIGRVDIVRALSVPQERMHYGDLKVDFENILVGIYLRNEDVYAKNVDYTTIIADVAFHITGRDVSFNLKEGLHESAYFNNRGSSNVETVIKESLPKGSILLHINKAKQVISNVLHVHLQRLYDEPVAMKWETRISVAFTLMVLFKLIILASSILLMINYVAFCYALKALTWHYVNLGTLYTLNLVNLALCLGLLITWSQLNNRNYQLFFLIMELISILGFNLVFFQSHQYLMKSNVVVTYSTLSSIYSNGDEEKTPIVNHNSPATGDGLTGKTVTRTRIPENKITERVDNIQGQAKRCFTAPVTGSTEWQL